MDQNKSSLIEFSEAQARLAKRRPGPQPEQLIFSQPTSGENYAGRILCLNPERARKFSCGGYMLSSPHLLSQVVPEEAQMEPIGRALRSGDLLDITESGAKTENVQLLSVNESDTEKKVYFTSIDGQPVVFGTSDKEEINRLDSQIQSKGLIELPPGWEDQEKYLIKTAPTPAPRKRSIKARLKERLYHWVNKL